jgi:hypothetical protein
MRGRRMPVGLAALLVCALLSVPVGGRATTPPTVPPPTYERTVSQELLIPMDDGVEIGATITFPSLDGKVRAPGRFPVVLSITPYGRNGACGCPDRAMFATRGIIGVTADTRGTGGSGGNLDENYFSPRESRDGYLLIEYFGTREYSTGRVGMAGGSYVGITQLLAAEQQPPHLSAIVPTEALSDVYRDAFAHGGIPNVFFDTQYIAVQGGPGIASTNTDPTFVRQSVMGKLQQLLGDSIAFDYLERPNDDPFYRDRSPIYNADKIQVPVLLTSGWRDGLMRGTMEMYHALAQRPGVETRLYMDPCTHKGCGAPFAPFTTGQGLDDLSAATFEFLAKYLLDAPTPSRSNVRVYVQAANRYVDDTQWPLNGTSISRLYLNHGALTATAPGAAAREKYVTDPAAGLSMTFDMFGTVAISPYVPTDQRLESLQGLSFRTTPLAQPLTLAGPIALHLVASSTATDTDWIAKLADVAPDGSESIISMGYLRASHRELDAARSREGVPYHTHTNPTAIEPGRAYSYDVEIWPTAYELAAGHRLQIRVTSFDVPTHSPAYVRFDRADPASTQIVPMLPAINAILEGGSDPSYLLISVLTGI